MRDVKISVGKLEKSMSGIETKLETILSFLNNFNNNRMLNGAEGGQDSEWKPSLFDSSDKKVYEESERRFETLPEENRHTQNFRDSLELIKPLPVVPIHKDSDSISSGPSNQGDGYESDDQNSTSSDPETMKKHDEEKVISKEDEVQSSDIPNEDLPATEDPQVLTKCNPDYSGAQVDLSKQQAAIHWDETSIYIPYSMLRREKTEPANDNRVTVLEEEGKEVKMDRDLSDKDTHVSMDLPSLRAARISALEHKVMESQKPQETLQEPETEVAQGQKAVKDEVDEDAPKVVEGMEQFLAPDQSGHIGEKPEPEFVMKTDDVFVSEPKKEQLDFSQNQITSSR